MLKVTELKNFKVTFDSRCIIDLTDAGEVGYDFGYGPDKASELPITIFEIICGDRNGEGNYQYWSRTIKPNIKGTQTCVILGDWQRNDTFNKVLTNNEAHGFTTYKDTFASLVRWLKQQGYETIELVVTRRNVGTSLNKIINSL